MDPTTLIFAILGLLVATLGWIEARKQRRIAEQALPPPIKDVEPPNTETQELNWRCGIYDYPPLSSWPDQSEIDPSGPLVWLARHIAEAIGKAITFHRFAYDDFYKETNSIPDMIVGMFETKRRSSRVVFSRSLYEIGLQGICRNEQEGDVLQELREGNLRVAVYSGEVGWEFVEDELPDAVAEHRVATVSGGHQMHTMVLLTQGVYDVVIMDSLSCFNFLNEQDHRQQFRLAFNEPPQKYRACMALKKEHAHCLDAINDAIINYRNSNEFLSIERHALAGFERIIERRALRSH